LNVAKEVAQYDRVQPACLPYASQFYEDIMYVRESNPKEVFVVCLIVTTIITAIYCRKIIIYLKKGAQVLFYDMVYRSDFVTTGSKSYFDNSDCTTSSNQDSA
jgi:hypothetical protein